MKTALLTASLFLTSSHVMAQCELTHLGEVQIDPKKGATADSIDVQGSHVFVVGRSSEVVFAVVDATDPFNPEVVALIGLGSNEFPGNGALDVEGDFAYVAGRDSKGIHGVHVIDVSTPGNPEQVHFFETGVFTRSVLVRGNVLFVLTTGGLQTFDIADPLAPVFLGSGTNATAGAQIDVNSNSDHVYVLDSEELVIVDVTDLSNPTAVGIHELGWTGSAFGVSGSRAFVASFSEHNGNTYGEVVSLSSPTMPGEYDEAIMITPLPRAAVARAGIVYVAIEPVFFLTEGAFGFMEAYDITEDEPELIASLNYSEIGDGNSDIAVQGSRAFLAEFDGYVHIVDLGVCPVIGLDVNDDGVLDGADLAGLLAVWGDGADAPGADQNGDGLVNGADLATLLANWGPLGAE